MKLFKSGDAGGEGGYRVVLIKQLRSWQLPQKERERGVISLEKQNGGGGEGGGFPGLATTAASPKFTREIYNSV